MLQLYVARKHNNRAKTVNPSTMSLPAPLPLPHHIPINPSAPIRSNPSLSLQIQQSHASLRSEPVDTVQMYLVRWASSHTSPAPLMNTLTGVVLLGLARRTKLV